NEEFVARNKKLIRLWSMFYPSLEVLLGITYVLILWIGGREVVSGQITIGSFAAFNVYMAQLSWPMIALGWVVNLFQRGTASLGRLDEIFRARPEIADRPGLALAPASGNGAGGSLHGIEVVFRNLSFAYDG